MPSVCLEADVRLAAGGVLSGVELQYERWGTRMAARDNVVLVCHALTSDARAADGGWWDSVIGPGKAIDTRRFDVVCSNVLGGSGGSTGPASVDPKTGRAYGSEFPLVTIADMVDAQAMLLDQLGVRRLHAVVGGCMGGFQALEWGRRHPMRCARVAALSATPSVAAYTIALWDVVRRAIRLDPAWNNGNFDDKPPQAGMALGSLIGLLLWMDFDTMQSRFGLTRHDPDALPSFAPDFEVERFLDRIAQRAGERIDPRALVSLTRAMDYFDLSRGYCSLAAGMSAARARFLLVSYAKDWRYPESEVERLADALRANGLATEHARLDSRLSHGAFQFEAETLEPCLRSFLEED